jgi:hypothetical protein
MYGRKRSWSTLRYGRCISLEELRNKMKNLSRDNASPSRDFNPGPQEYGQRSYVCSHAWGDTIMRGRPVVMWRQTVVTLCTAIYPYTHGELRQRNETKEQVKTGDRKDIRKEYTNKRHLYRAWRLLMSSLDFYRCCSRYFLYS